MYTNKALVIMNCDIVNYWFFFLNHKLSNGALAIYQLQLK